MNASRLRCAGLIDPLGVDSSRPLLTWWPVADDPGSVPEAYQLQVAESPQHLHDGVTLWDTGRVADVRCSRAVYGGPDLVSRQRVAWRVRVWDRQGGDAPWSETAAWEMGLLGPGDWTGQWVHDPRRESSAHGRPSRFRRVVGIDGSAVRARLYASALGAYRAVINGVDVSDWQLQPGWTDYRVRATYQAYDVRPLLHHGENVVGLTLADAWFSGRVAWLRSVYGTWPSVIAQLEVTLDTGEEVRVGTDGTWQTAWSPILHSDILDGETADLRREDDALRAPGQVRGWRRAVLTTGVDTALVARSYPPVRETEQVTPVTTRRIDDGRVVVDLGQNFAGRMRLQVAGPPGARVTVRHAEMLDTDGNLYTANLRAAAATDTYVLAGQEVETLEPVFVYHGFRHASVQASAGVRVDSVRGVVLHNDLERTGHFTCSSGLLNQLHHNIEWGLRSNFIEVPTDCPQRDERLGWLGDIQVFAPTATFLVDCHAFLAKWVQDVVDGQSPDGGVADVAPRLDGLPGNAPWPDAGPAWGDAVIIVPWSLYRAYGDLELVDRHFDAMDRWIRRLDAANPDHRWRALRGNDYGDWLSIGEDTDKELLASAYFAHSTGLLARMARLVGRDRRADQLDHLRDAIVRTFRADWMHDDGSIGDDTQTAYVLSLRFGLVDDASRPAAVEHLVRRLRDAGWHLRTGFLGVSHLLPVLESGGRLDVAYRLLLAETYPSWGYSIRHGATTIWERWNGWTEHDGFENPGMNSFNHYALGSVGAWMYETVGGIALDPSVPAYRTAHIRPQPGGGITDARTALDSPQGRIECAWRLEDGEMHLDTTIPPGADGVLRLPARHLDDVSDSAGTTLRGASVVETGAGHVSVAVGPGRHSVRIRRPIVVDAVRD